MLPEHPTPDEAEDRFRELVDNAGMPQPDEVRYDGELDELLFLWHEEKLAVVVELSESAAGPTMPPV